MTAPRRQRQDDDPPVPPLHQMLELIRDLAPEYVLPDRRDEYQKRVYALYRDVTRASTGDGYRTVTLRDDDGLEDEGRKFAVTRVSKPRTRRRRKPVPAGRVAPGLAFLLSALNAVAQHPEGGSFLRGCNRLAQRRDYRQARAAVEEILETPPEEREWGEPLALNLVVHDIIHRGPRDGWARLMLDGLRDPLAFQGTFPPRLRPTDAPRWYPLSLRPLQRLAEILMQLPDDVLGRLRRCAACDTAPDHRCVSGGPYLLDRSRSAHHHPRHACCPAHRTASHRRKALPTAM